MDWGWQYCKMFTKSVLILYKEPERWKKVEDVITFEEVQRVWYIFKLVTKPQCISTTGLLFVCWIHESLESKRCEVNAKVSCAWCYRCNWLWYHWPCIQSCEESKSRYRFPSFVFMNYNRLIQVPPDIILHTLPIFRSMASVDKKLNLFR
jgi:hypothetical protein